MAVQPARNDTVAECTGGARENGIPLLRFCGYSVCWRSISYKISAPKPPRRFTSVDGSI
jgi:hypothetical protein